MKKTLIIIFFVSLTCCVSHSKVLAQEAALELTVTPPTAYLKIKPGGEATHTITLSNSGTKAITVQPQLYDFTTDGKSGKPILTLEKETTFPYLDADGKSFQQLTITPNTKAQLTLHFTVPQGVPNKEYLMTLLFTSIPQEKNGQASTSTEISASIGSNLVVLVSTNDNPDPDFSFKSFQTSKIKDSFRPFTFKPLIENKGFSATVASGSAEIKNWQGKVVATFPVYPVVVLGGSSRELQAQVNQGKKNPEQIIPGDFYYKQPFFLGVYSVTLNLYSIADPQKVILTATENIIELPLLLIICATIGAAIIVTYRVRNRRKSSLF